MVALGSDHAGYKLKEKVKSFLESKSIKYIDFGAYHEKSCDYPDMAVEPCKAVLSGNCSKALLFCGTGIGISIAANKIKGIRAAVCSDCFSAKFSRLHNDANVLCLGERVLSSSAALELVDIFLTTEFEGGRHQKRVDKIINLENKNV